MLVQAELFPEIAEQERQREKLERLELAKKAPFFADPKNDNERLMNLQREYLLKNDATTEAHLWTYSLRVAGNIIKKEMRVNHLPLDRDDIEDKKYIAVEYVLKRYKKKYRETRTRKYKYWAVDKSFICALYKGVIHALYYQTRNEALENEAIKLTELGYPLNYALELARARVIQSTRKAAQDNKQLTFNFGGN